MVASVAQPSVAEKVLVPAQDSAVPVKMTSAMVVSVVQLSAAAKTVLVDLTSMDKLAFRLQALVVLVLALQASVVKANTVRSAPHPLVVLLQVILAHPMLNQELEAHPLMVKELEAQASDIKALVVQVILDQALMVQQLEAQASVVKALVAQVKLAQAIVELEFKHPTLVVLLVLMLQTLVLEFMESMLRA